MIGFKVAFAIAGDYAVALHGAVRGTVDLDLVIRLTKNDFLSAEAALKALGLASRLPVDGKQVFDFREEYIKNKNLIAWSFWNPSNPAEIVDLLIAQDLRKLHIKNIRAGELTLPVLSPPDLIAMKKTAGRPQDMEDVKALEQLKK